MLRKDALRLCSMATKMGRSAGIVPTSNDEFKVVLDDGTEYYSISSLKREFISNLKDQISVLDQLLGDTVDHDRS